MATGNRVEIELNFSRYCIETAAKKTYEKRIREYFSKGKAHSLDLEKEISLLKYFLETADFQSLRTLCSQTGKNHAVLVTQKDNRLKLKFDDSTKVELP